MKTDEVTMKLVLFVHQSSEMYGSDKVLLLLAQGLQARREFHPVVVLPSYGPLHVALSDSGIEVHVAEVAKISRAVFSLTGLFGLARKTFQAIRGLDRIIAGRPVGVVHSNTLAVLAGSMWALFRGEKHLWHVHEIILSPRFISKAFPYLVRLLSDKVMSNSTLTERWLLGEQPKLTARSVVVFNGVPIAVKPIDSEIQAFRQRIGAAAGDVVITLAGRINRWKGQDLLIQAAEVLKRTNRAHVLHFVIVGGPAPGLEDLPNQLKSQVAQIGMSDRFSFLPFVDDIWPVWFGTDIAVVPSTEPEPFGMVAIEAMSAGVPVVAAGHGGLLDIVVHDETGLIFPPRDAQALADSIYRLASNLELRKKLGSSGAKRQREHFSVESQVALTSEVYMEMIR